MLKGLNKILNACNDFIAEIDEELEDVQVSDIFFCYPTTKEVFITLAAEENGLDEFIDNLLSRTTVRDISPFTWSLLHEVGHCETWHLLTEKVEHRCRNRKRKIERGGKRFPTVTYFALTDERIATNWAIKFVSQNYDFVKTFDKKILKILDKFYADNGVDVTGVE
jgi:hypothetical protein